MPATVKVKASRFDSDAVKRALSRGRRTALSLAARAVWRVMRASMHRAKGPSAPGTAPHVHKGQLRKLLEYGYDLTTQTSVVGPRALGAAIVPRLMEMGGAAPSRRRRAAKHGRAPAAGIYPARPYAAPALAVARPELPRAWAGVIR